MEPFIDPNHKSMGLASDLNNPNFVGAINPDSALHVRFYSRPVMQPFRSNAEGHPIFEDTIYIEIYTPGSQLNTIDRPKRPEDEARFPLQWAHYKNIHGADGQVVGTPLNQWPLLTPAQAETLKALKFFTVESIAFASDLQLQPMGIGVTGISAMALRDRAKTYLAVAKDSAFASKQAEEIKKRDEQIAAQGEQLVEMQKQMQALAAKVAAQPVPKKPGRPKKVTETVADTSLTA